MKNGNQRCQSCEELQGDILETSRQLELFAAAYSHLESQIIAFRDRAVKYEDDCKRIEDADGAAENAATRRCLDELARLAKFFKPNA